jgi:hypothetical protein
MLNLVYFLDEQINFPSIITERHTYFGNLLPKVDIVEQEIRLWGKNSLRNEHNGKMIIAKNKILFSIWFYNIYSHFAEKFRNEFLIVPAGQLTNSEENPFTR